MRKVQLVIISFLLVFTLTGCDLFNKEQIATLEEYCVDNPNDETCILDEEIQIEEAFLDLYDAYLKAPETFCDTYLDASIEAQNDCEFMYSDVLPHNLLEYTITSVERTSSNSNTEYAIVFNNEKDNKQAIVTLETSFEGAGVIIKSLSYEVTMINALSEEELIVEIKKIITKDLSLYLEDFDHFSRPFPNDDGSERLNNWHIMNNNEMFYEIGQHVLNEDGSYTFYIYEVLNVVRISDDTLTVYPTYINGELVIGYEDEYSVSKENTNRVSLDTLINYLAYSNVTLREITNVFTMDDYGDVVEIYTFLHNQLDYTITPSTESEYLYTITANTVYTDTVMTLRYSYDSETNSHYLKLEDVIVSDVEEVKPELVVDDFIKKYMFAEKSADEMNLYFTDEMPSELMDLYNTFSGYITGYEFYTIDGENTLYINFSSQEFFYDVDFLLQTDGTYKMTFTLEKDIDLSELYDVESYFDQFLYEVSLHTDSACLQYFDDSSFGYCSEVFNQIDAYNYNISSISNMGEYTSVIFFYNRDKYNNVFNVDFTYNQLENGTYQFHMVNSPFEKEEISELILDFTTAINDTVSVESITDEFLDTSNSSLNELISYLRSNNYHVSLEDNNVAFSSNYFVYNVYDSSGVFMKTMFIEFDVSRIKSDDIYQHKIEINSISEISLSISQLELEKYLDDIAIDVNSNDYQMYEFCERYGDMFLPCRDTLRFFEDIDDDISVSSIEVFDDDNEYTIIFTATNPGSLDSGLQYGYGNTLFFYKVDGEIYTKIIYADMYNLPETLAPFDTTAAREDFLIFLNDLIDKSKSSSEITVYYQNNDVYSFIFNRDDFIDFVRVEHTQNLEETNHATKDSYTFFDANGEETIVVYYLVRGHSEGVFYSVLKDYTGEEPETFTNEELVDYLNGDITLDIGLDFYENGTSTDLVSYLNDNNYSLLLITGNYNNIDCAVLDENEDVLYLVSYKYSVQRNMLNHYYIKGQVEDIISEHYTALEDYIDKLEEELDNGSFTLDELDTLTNSFDYFPETYTTIVFDSIYLTNIFKQEVGDTYKVIVTYKIDGEEYNTFHNVTVDITADETTFTWENIGYNGPVPLGPVASLEDATRVIKNFMSDYFNPELTQDYIEDTYFNGMMLDDFNEEERNEMLLDEVVFEVGEVTSVMNDGLVVGFDLAVTLSYPDVYEGDISFNVIALGNDQFYLVIID